MIIYSTLNWLSHTISLILNAETSVNSSNDDYQTAQSGQGLVEYALILILVAVAVVALLIILGPAIGNMYQNILELVRGNQN